MQETNKPSDLEKENQDDWLPRFLNSESFTEAQDILLPKTQILQEYHQALNSGTQ